MPNDYYDDETETYKSDFLYFVQAGDRRGPVKIGRTNNVKSRLRRLQTGNPAKLNLLYAAENAGWQEAFWHHAFRYDHELGEWFEPKFGLLKAIKLFARGEPWFIHARQCPLDNYDPIEWAEHLHDAFEAYEEMVMFEQWRGPKAAEYAIEDPDFDGKCITTVFLEALAA